SPPGLRRAPCCRRRRRGPRRAEREPRQERRPVTGRCRRSNAFARSSATARRMPCQEAKPARVARPSRYVVPDEVRFREGSADALDREAVLDEGGQDLLAVLLVTGDDRQLDARIAEVERDALALVLDRDEVASLARDQLEQLDQLPRAVGEPA